MIITTKRIRCHIQINNNKINLIVYQNNVRKLNQNNIQNNEKIKQCFEMRKSVASSQQDNENVRQEKLFKMFR